MKLERAKIQAVNIRHHVEVALLTNMVGSCKQIWKGKGDKYKLCTLHHIEAALLPNKYGWLMQTNIKRERGQIQTAHANKYEKERGQIQIVRTSSC